MRTSLEERTDSGDTLVHIVDEMLVM